MDDLVTTKRLVDLDADHAYLLDGRYWIETAQSYGRYINADELVKRLEQAGLTDAVKIAVKMAGHERVKMEVDG